MAIGVDQPKQHGSSAKERQQCQREYSYCRSSVGVINLSRERRQQSVNSKDDYSRLSRILYKVKSQEN